ncbi:hypothetical protein OH775_38150 [Streptomyces sp. NBC_01615]
MPTSPHAFAAHRQGLSSDGDPVRVGPAAPGPGHGDSHPESTARLPGHGDSYGRPCVRSAAPLPVASTARNPYARLARGCRPRGCRAPARRVHGRRVRYVIGDEPGQVNGMRWRLFRGAGSCASNHSRPAAG